MAAYDAILLDIDGTLIDSNYAHAETWSRASAALGFGRPIEFFLPLMGMGGDVILPRIDRTLNEHADPGKAIVTERKRLVLNDYAPQFKATRGSRAFVAGCKARGLRCIVATSSSEEELNLTLQVAGIADLIDERVTSRDAEHTKPAPDIIAAALAKGKIAPGRALLIGDTPYDIEAARQAGVDTVALRTGGFSDAELAGAIAIFDDPAAVLEQLAQLLDPKGEEKAA